MIPPKAPFYMRGRLSALTVIAAGQAVRICVLNVAVDGEGVNPVHAWQVPRVGRDIGN